MTRHGLLTLILAFLSAALLNAQEVRLFGERDITGTARYSGMAGAMAAVGADPSAVLDNPAGLGLYHRMEVSLTLREVLNYDYQLPSPAFADLTKDGSKKQRQFVSTFQLPQASMVFSLENQGGGAMKYCNFMISYNRLQSFNRSALASGFNQPSISNLMIDQIDRTGLDITEDYLGGSKYQSPQTAWLSEVGYWGYMINPIYEINSNGDTIGFNGWQAAYGIQPETMLNVKESGYVDEFTLNWAGNFFHTLHIGLGLNIRSLSYTKALTYTEWFNSTDNEQEQLYSYLRQTGIGVSGTLGVIYQPTNWLRAGLSVQSPVGINLNTTSYADLTYYDGYGTQKQQDLTDYYRNRQKLSTPLRTTAGLAFIASDKALFSLQYDYRHDKSILDVHTIKAGAEIVALRNLFMNIGYACESEFVPYDKQPIVLLEANDPRTDADYKQHGTAHYATAGIGYRGSHVIAQLAYQCRYSQYMMYPFAISENFSDWQPDGFKQEAISHRIVLTLAWHTK